MSASDELSSHRFFRAMVLMGSSLALACGGESIAEGGADGGTGNAGNGGSAGGGSGGTGTAGSMPAAGGSIPVAGNTSMGGTAGTGPVVVPNMDCSSDFWSCGDILNCINSPRGYTLPTDCKCDFSRPTSGSQCSSGRRVCLMATTDQDGNPFANPVPFQCTCASDATSCSDSCHAAFPDGDGHECTDTIGARLAAPADPVGPGGSDILCGCSFVYLK